MSKFFYNIADKNACFLSMINCKILVTRDLEKQTLITNTPQSPTLKENTPSVKLRKKICLFIS